MAGVMSHVGASQAIGVSHRYLNAASEDPSAFGAGSGGSWAALTLAGARQPRLAAAVRGGLLGLCGKD